MQECEEGDLGWICVVVIVLVMGVTCHGAVCPAVPARAGALVQAEVWAADAALQVLGCREYLGLLSDVLQDACHLGGTVLPSGGATGGREQAAQHQRGWKER